MIQFYYLSHNKEVQIVSIKDNQQALNVLSKKVLIEKKINQALFEFIHPKIWMMSQAIVESQLNFIKPQFIRYILDALGKTRKYAFCGGQLRDIIFRNHADILEVFKMAERDGLISSYLYYLLRSYINLFKQHYGRLILVTCQKGEIRSLPSQLKLIYSDQISNYYSCFDYAKATNPIIESGFKLKTSLLKLPSSSTSSRSRS